MGFLTGELRGNRVGEMWENGVGGVGGQGVASEEGSEPGALRGCDAVCHGRGRWGGVL